MTAVRIGLDARLTRQLSVGMKTYVSELVGRLPRVAPQYEYVTFRKGGNFGLTEQIMLPLAMARARLNLAHFLSLYVPVLMPKRSIVTVHDLIHLRFPQYFKAKVRPYYQTVVRSACARARRIITDDERTVDDLVELLGVDRAKVRVVPLGVDQRFFAPVAAYAAARPYVLYVGNHRRHKDLATLFEAWSNLTRAYPIDLYLTGPDDFGTGLARRNAAGGEIVVLGDVSVDALHAYYAAAVALVQPALREGFGLPMLEAMAAGCPVVACEDAVPRVLMPHALGFPARNPASLSERLGQVLDDQGLRARLIEGGREIARTLTWDRCAAATAEVYREVLEER